MSTKNLHNYPAAGPIATFGVVIVMGLLLGLVLRMTDPRFRPKDKVRTSGVTNELVQIATGATNGATNNPKGRAVIFITNFTGGAFVDYPWNGGTNKPTLSTLCAHAYESGVETGYILGRIMASRETVRMYVRAYNAP